MKHQIRFIGIILMFVFFVQVVDNQGIQLVNQANIAREEQKIPQASNDDQWEYMWTTESTIGQVSNIWGTQADSQGNIIVGGMLNPLGETYQNTYIIQKISPTGDPLVDANYPIIGPYRTDYGLNLIGFTLDDEDNIFIYGEKMLVPSYDYVGSVLIKISPTGVPIWTYFSENSRFYGMNFTSDAIYICGNNGDAAIWKLDLEGNLIEGWPSMIDRGYPNEGFIGMNFIDENIYVVYRHDSNLFNFGTRINLIYKFTMDGQPIYDNFWPVQIFDDPAGFARNPLYMMHDRFGNLYFSGWQLKNQYEGGDFVIKISTISNQILWDRVYDGTSEIPTLLTFSMSMDSNDYLYFAGAMQSKKPGVSAEAFVSKMDTDGNYIWSKIWGTTPLTFALSIYIDDDNKIYVSGNDKQLIGNNIGICKFNPKAPVISAWFVENPAFSNGVITDKYDYIGYFHVEVVDPSGNILNTTILKIDGQETNFGPSATDIWIRDTDIYITQDAFCCREYILDVYTKSNNDPYLESVSRNKITVIDDDTNGPTITITPVGSGKETEYNAVSIQISDPKLLSDYEIWVDGSLETKLTGTNMANYGPETIPLSNIYGQHTVQVIASDSDNIPKSSSLTRTFSWNDDDITPPTIDIQYNGIAEEKNPGEWTVHAYDISGIDYVTVEIINRHGSTEFFGTYTEITGTDFEEIFPVPDHFGGNTIRVTVTDADNDPNHPNDSLTSTKTNLVNIFDDDLEKPVISIQYVGSGREDNPGDWQITITDENDISAIVVKSDGITVLNEIGFHKSPYTFSTPLLPEFGYHTIEVTATDNDNDFDHANDNNQNTASNAQLLDDDDMIGPDLEILVSGNLIEESLKTWNIIANDPEKGVSKLEIWIDKLPNTIPTKIVNLPSAPTQYIENVDIPDLEGDHTIYVRATDNDNIRDHTSATRTDHVIDNDITAPSISISYSGAQYPANGNKFRVTLTDESDISSYKVYINSQLVTSGGVVSSGSIIDAFIPISDTSLTVYVEATDNDNSKVSGTFTYSKSLKTIILPSSFGFTPYGYTEFSNNYDSGLDVYCFALKNQNDQLNQVDIYLTATNSMDVQIGFYVDLTPYTNNLPRTSITYMKSYITVGKNSVTNEKIATISVTDKTIINYNLFQSGMDWLSIVGGVIGIFSAVPSTLSQYISVASGAKNLVDLCVYDPDYYVQSVFSYTLNIRNLVIYEGNTAYSSYNSGSLYSKAINILFRATEEQLNDAHIAIDCDIAAKYFTAAAGIAVILLQFTAAAVFSATAAAALIDKKYYINQANVVDPLVPDWDIPFYPEYNNCSFVEDPSSILSITAYRAMQTSIKLEADFKTLEITNNRLQTAIYYNDFESALLQANMKAKYLEDIASSLEISKELKTIALEETQKFYLANNVNDEMIQQVQENILINGLPDDMVIYLHELNFTEDEIQSESTNIAETSINSEDIQFDELIISIANTSTALITIFNEKYVDQEEEIIEIKTEELGYSITTATAEDENQIGSLIDMIEIAESNGQYKLEMAYCMELRNLIDQIIEYTNNIAYLDYKIYANEHINYAEDQLSFTAYLVGISTEIDSGSSFQVSTYITNERYSESSFTIDIFSNQISVDSTGIHVITINANATEKIDYNINIPSSTPTGDYQITVRISSDTTGDVVDLIYNIHVNNIGGGISLDEIELTINLEKMALTENGILVEFTVESNLEIPADFCIEITLGSHIYTDIGTHSALLCEIGDYEIVATIYNSFNENKIESLEFTITNEQVKIWVLESLQNSLTSIENSQCSQWKFFTSRIAMWLELETIKLAVDCDCYLISLLGLKAIMALQIQCAITDIALRETIACQIKTAIFGLELLN